MEPTKPRVKINLLINQKSFSFFSQNIFKTFSIFFQNIFKTFSKHFQFFSKTFSIFFQNIFNFFPEHSQMFFSSFNFMSGPHGPGIAPSNAARLRNGFAEYRGGYRPTAANMSRPNTEAAIALRPRTCRGQNTEAAIALKNTEAAIALKNTDTAAARRPTRSAGFSLHSARYRAAGGIPPPDPPDVAAAIVARKVPSTHPKKNNRKAAAKPRKHSLLPWVASCR